MKTIRIHISNYDRWMDEKIFVDVKLQTVPRVGEHLWLSTELQSDLENQIVEGDDAPSYDQWFYGQQNPENLSLDDAQWIISVLHKTDEPEITHIELGNND